MARDFFAENFGLDDAVYRRVLAAALASGGDHCDLFFQQITSTVIGLEDNEVNRAFRSSDLGVGIRVVKGDSYGYAFCEDLEEKSMRDAASVAASIATSGKQSEPQKIRSIVHHDLYSVKTPWSTVTTDQKMPILHKINQQAFDLDKRVEKVRVRFADLESHVLIVDSLGRKTHDHRPMTVTYVFCVAQDKGCFEENYCSVGARQDISLYSDELIDGLAEKAVKRTMVLFEAKRPEGGELPVVLASGSSGILLHEAIGHGMEADFNRKGVSIYSGAIGKQIAKPFVSIVDDGTIENARGSINSDDEGNGSKRTVLVENGVFKTYLHDKISADHYGVEPTGNGRRQSFRSPPLPRMRCTYMTNGPHHKEEILKSVKHGIYAESFTNGQVQIGAGDFTFYIKNGYMIEDGKLTWPIKDVNLIGNGPEVLEDVEMVANDMVLDTGGWTCGKDGQSVAVSLGMPTVKVSKMTVGGVEMQEGK